MYKAIILPLARQDIKEAAKWYNERQRGLGKRFTQHVRQKVKYVYFKHNVTPCGVVDLMKR